MATSLTIEILTDVSKAVSGIDQVEGKTKSFGSKMGAVAGALGGALSLDKIQGWVQGWLDAGLDASRAAKDVKVAFGDSAADVLAWGDTAAKTFGTTAADAEKMAATTGIALEGYGMSHADAAKAAEALVQRSADVAKVYGTDTQTVLDKVSSAMRGRTQGVKDYGVQIEKGSDSTAIFNGFMDQTAQMAGQSDTKMGEFHATMGDLSATLGTALVPILGDVMKVLQPIADWATNNKAAFQIIVFTFVALAAAFGIAAVVGGVLAVVTWAILWPILAVVAGVAALIVVVVLVVKNWSTLVNWFHIAVDAINGVIQAIWGFLQVIGAGFLSGATAAIDAFKKAWDGVKKAVDFVHDAITKVLDIAGKVFDKIGSIISKIPGISHIPGVSSAGAGASPSAYGAAGYAAPITFAPSITFTGDVGDPTLAGRRIVAALESWAASNGRRRIAALVAP